MLRDDTKLPAENIQFLFDDGGLGDNICRMSAVKYVRDHYKHVQLYVYVPDYFLELARHLVPGPRVTIRSYGKDKDLWVKAYASRRTTNDHHTTMKTHLVDHTFHVLADKAVEVEHKNYCRLRLNRIDVEDFALPEKYIIITTGFTADVREMLPEVVNKLSDYVISKGYTPVYLGSKKAIVGRPEVPNIEGVFKSEIDYSKGLDLIDKTSLLEAGKIISNAKCLIGMDNGLMHLAGCTDIPIVGGFTTVEPKFRMPYRHDELGWNFYPVVPDVSLKCRFCQSNWEFVYDHDFRSCWYKEQKLDTEIKCVKMLTAEKYIVELEKIL